MGELAVGLIGADQGGVGMGSDDISVSNDSVGVHTPVTEHVTRENLQIFD